MDTYPKIMCTEQQRLLRRCRVRMNKHPLICLFKNKNVLNLTDEFVKDETMRSSENGRLSNSLEQLKYYE